MEGQLMSVLNGWRVPSDAAPLLVVQVVLSAEIWVGRWGAGVIKEWAGEVEEVSREVDSDLLT